MNNLGNSLGNYMYKELVCSNPTNFLMFLNCNKYQIIIIAICVFLFYLGIAILIKLHELDN